MDELIKSDPVKCDGSGDCSNCVFDDCVFNAYWDDYPDEWFEHFGEFGVYDTIPF